MRTKAFPFFPVLFCIGIFFLIISPYIFSHGMFMDGLIYGSVAKNLASGSGTFWNLHFTNTAHPLFHEHPPLVFGIESLFFKIFGNGIYTERIYSLFIFFSTGGIIILIWKEISGSVKMSWLPLLFWVCTPPVSWACQNNVLESTLTLFILLSIFFYLRFVNKNSFIFLFFSGLSIFFSLFSKGPVGLFPLAMPFCYWIATKKINFIQTAVQTFLLIAFSFLPLAIIYFSSTDAAESMKDYLHVQVMNSLKNVATVDTRFYIVGATLLDLLPSLAFCLIAIIYFQRKRMQFFPSKEKNALSRFFIFLGLCAILPIMVSMKQRSFYAVPAFPVFILGFCSAIYPQLEKIRIGNKFNSFLKVTSVLIFSLGIGASVFFAGKFGRDEEQITDVFNVIKIVGSKETLSICHYTRGDWYLHGYFGRYSDISLDDSENNLHPYYLAANNCEGNLPLENYEEVKVKLNQYRLFRKKE